MKPCGSFKVLDRYFNVFSIINGEKEKFCICISKDRYAESSEFAKNITNNSRFFDTINECKLFINYLIKCYECQELKSRINKINSAVYEEIKWSYDGDNGFYISDNKETKLPDVKHPEILSNTVKWFYDRSRNRFPSNIIAEIFNNKKDIDFCIENIDTFYNIINNLDNDDKYLIKRLYKDEVVRIIVAKELECSLTALWRRTQYIFNYVKMRFELEFDKDNQSILFDLFLHGLNNRSATLIRKNKITSLSYFKDKTYSDIINLKGCGDKSAHDIIDNLKCYGIII